MTESPEGVRVGRGHGAPGPPRPLDLGVIGVSEGNGHPYSFSAIVNGYDDAGMAASGWDVIHDYLREKDASEFGFPGVAVTHAWTQDPAETERLCAAARIPNAVADRSSLVDAVDAVLLLRDDHETHRELAEPFLEAGLPVFVDKPLAVDVEDLRAFRPYLEAGQLMSCSGMRYARELDGPRATVADYGEVRLARGAVLKDWSSYGVHMLDAVFGVLECRPTAVRAVPGDASDIGDAPDIGDASDTGDVSDTGDASDTGDVSDIADAPTIGDAKHASVTIETDATPLVRIDALGDAAFAFDVDVYGTERRSRHVLRDNFRAFRRTLHRFLEMVRTGDPQLAPEATLDVMRTVVAGRRSFERGERVALADVEV